MSQQLTLFDNPVVPVKFNRVHFSSLDEGWTTPKQVFDYFNDQFGFTLDACASEENHLCPEFYTKERNALKMRWHPRTFINPPYSRSIGKWIAKGYEESLLGNTVVMLLPSRTDTKWFHQYCIKGEILFIKGRLRFGGKKNSAPFPSMVVIFSPQDSRLGSLTS